MDPAPILPGQLLAVSPGLGREAQRLAIPSEGNTSAGAGAASFLVKAGGSNVARLAAAGRPRSLTTADAGRCANRNDPHYRHRSPGLGGDSVPSLPWPPRS